jgi:predicted O-methyltransferase YrrM
MNMSSSDRAFAGSIPQLYEQYLVPLIFDPYARDLTHRVVSLAPSAVLEIATGTGVVTRHLAAQLPADVSIVSTDLNQAMLDRAMSVVSCSFQIRRQPSLRHAGYYVQVGHSCLTSGIE